MAGAVAFMVKMPHGKNGMLATTRGGWGSRKAAREAFMKSMRGRNKKDWSTYYKTGCRVVMVDIRELKQR